MIAQRFKRQQPFHILCQKLKYVRVVKMPQHIHLLFDIVAIRAASTIQFLRQPCPRPRPIRHDWKIVGVKQLIQQNGVAAQIFAGPLARAGELRQYVPVLVDALAAAPDKLHAGLHFPVTAANAPA